MAPPLSEPTTSISYNQYLYNQYLPLTTYQLLLLTLSWVKKANILSPSVNRLIDSSTGSVDIPGAVSPR